MQECTLSMENNIDDSLLIVVSGDWMMGNVTPQLSDVLARLGVLNRHKIQIDTALLIGWDSRFVLFIFESIYIP